MKLHHFVCGSSVILAGWLALTFVVHVPVQRYQKPEALPAASVPQHSTVAVACAAATPAAVDFSGSASR